MNKQLPPAERTVKFCDKCGRTNDYQRLNERHWANGDLCKGGTLKTVTYRRDDSTIQEAGDDNDDFQP